MGRFGFRGLVRCWLDGQTRSCVAEAALAAGVAEAALAAAAAQGRLSDLERGAAL